MLSLFSNVCNLADSEKTHNNLNIFTVSCKELNHLGFVYLEFLVFFQNFFLFKVLALTYTLFSVSGTKLCVIAMKVYNIIREGKAKRDLLPVCQIGQWRRN